MNFPHPTFGQGPSQTDEDSSRTTLIRSLPPQSEENSSEYDILSQGELTARERRENDFMHASFVSSTNSTVRVEINDEPRGGTMNTLAASAILRKCKQQVFKPYSKLLLFIGWRPFGRERFNYHCGWKTLNLVYPVFVVCLLFYAYAYELLACQGKLDIDEHDIPVPSPTDIIPTGKIGLLSSYGQNTTTHITVTASAVTAHTPQHQGLFSNCNHIITSYLIPDVLHFVAFLLGFWYFRIQDNEQMYALIEQVFLLITPLPHGIQTQSDMIRSMRRILLMGAVWIIATLAVQGIFLGAFGYEDFTVQVPNIPQIWNLLLLLVDVFGFLIINSINTAVVVNYAVQCETIIIYADSIKEQLLEKSARLQNIMHDLYRVWQAILRLNGAMSKMTSICTFYFAERFVIGLCLLILNKHKHALMWTYRSVYPIMWLVILSFPLIQALRVNGTLEELRETSMEVRVFGYHNSPIEELDSFQHFVANGKIHAKLMCVPVKSSYVCGSVICTVFILIILTQTGVLTGKSTFF